MLNESGILTRSTSTLFTNYIFLFLFKTFLFLCIETFNLFYFHLFGDTFSFHNLVSFILSLLHLLFHSFIVSDFSFNDLLRSSSVNGHKSFLFSIDFVFSDGEMFEDVLFFIINEPGRKIVLVFKGITRVSRINNIFSSSLSLHFLC